MLTHKQVMATWKQTPPYRTLQHCPYVHGRAIETGLP